VGDVTASGPMGRAKGKCRLDVKCRIELGSIGDQLFWCVCFLTKSFLSYRPIIPIDRFFANKFGQNKRLEPSWLRKAFCRRTEDGNID
jgi:hypothetical protein